MAFCLDTDVVIEFFRGNEKIVQKVKEHSGSDLYITYITLCELFRGVYLSNNPKKEFEMINLLLETCKILDFSLPSCIAFGSNSAILIKGGENG